MAGSDHSVSVNARVRTPTDEEIPHRRLDVFVGPDAYHRAFAGTLVLRVEEVDAVLALFNGEVL